MNCLHQAVLKLAALTIAACLFGCGKSPSVTWDFNIEEHHGNVVYDTTGLCIVFEGNQKPMFGNSGGLLGSGGLLIFSENMGESTSGGPEWDPNRSSSSYDPATRICTIECRKHRIEIKKKGGTVAVDGVEFSLSGKPKQTISIPTTGRPAMREFRSSDSSGEPLGDVDSTPVKRTAMQ